MGRPTRDSEAFRDDPDALSMHTTPDDFNYDDAPEISGLPPAYTDDVGGSSSTRPAPRHIPPPPSNRMDHDAGYSLSGGKPVVCEVSNVMDSRYDTDPVYLEQAIREMAMTAPEPLVYIMGHHSETRKVANNKKETQQVVDFRLVLSLKEYLRPDSSQTMTVRTVENGEKVLRGSFIKQRAPGYTKELEVGLAKPELKEWCHRYCASPSTLRVFRLSRTVSGIDTTPLKNRLEGLIRSTNYRGRISITFPIEDRYVDLYTSSRINSWRLTTWIRWLFYLSFLWIFAWPYLFFATKRYAVVEAVWPFSTVNAAGQRHYTTLSEEQWFERWHVGIRRLVLDRHQRSVSDAQLAGVIERPEDPPMPGTIRTGHEGVDTAVGFLTQGIQVARALQGRGAPGGGWGGDYNGC
ncbi:hypothetical protein BU16DRAFT_522049 [Lophium mytilinum]|uniref:Uncharacterized protein n=1 Tax=Lophium mytilinum TaxID=390894 RepID=A0A6A6R851_9PEZI|nr:hypothetical protein BU16DRAFT_522049 [Lophium mytilinum]